MSGNNAGCGGEDCRNAQLPVDLHFRGMDESLRRGNGALLKQIKFTDSYLSAIMIVEIEYLVETENSNPWHAMETEVQLRFSELMEDCINCINSNLSDLQCDAQTRTFHAILYLDNPWEHAEQAVRELITNTVEQHGACVAKTRAHTYG